MLGGGRRGGRSWNFVAESALLTVFVIAGNTLLRPLVNRINRIPIDEKAGEATYEVRLIANPRAADDAREALIEALEKLPGIDHATWESEVLKAGRAGARL